MFHLALVDSMLLKKMNLEVKQLEQGIQKTIEDQRREVSRQ